MVLPIENQVWTIKFFMRSLIAYEPCLVALIWQIVKEQEQEEKRLEDAVEDFFDTEFGDAEGCAESYDNWWFEWKLIGYLDATGEPDSNKVPNVCLCFQSGAYGTGCDSNFFQYTIEDGHYVIEFKAFGKTIRIQVSTSDTYEEYKSEEDILTFFADQTIQSFLEEAENQSGFPLGTILEQALQ